PAAIRILPRSSGSIGSAPMHISVNHIPWHNSVKPWRRFSVEVPNIAAIDLPGPRVERFAYLTMDDGAAISFVTDVIITRCGIFRVVCRRLTCDVLRRLWSIHNCEGLL